MEARLAHFWNDEEESEYVVIITDDSSPESHCKPGYKLSKIVGIGPADEFSEFPCDMPLVAE